MTTCITPCKQDGVAEAKDSNVHRKTEDFRTASISNIVHIDPQFL